MSNSIDHHLGRERQSRPKAPILFPNGARSELDYCATIDLEEIADLTVADVYEAFLNAIKSHPLGLRDGDLFIRMPNAEKAFGINLGYSRLESSREDPNQDEFSIFVEDGNVRGTCIWAEFPAVKDEHQARSMLQEALLSSSVAISELSLEKSDRGPCLAVTLHSPEGIAIRDLAFHCQTAIALLHGASELTDSPLAVYRNLSLGRWDRLTGELETDWLEVKQKMYGTQNPRQKFEMALDIASMANLDSGGIIIVGFETSRNSHGQDVISSTTGKTRLEVSVPQLNATVENMVYPKISQLLVSIFHKNDREVLAILVPPQPARQRPFLVKGTAIDQDRMYGGGFTWVSRGNGAKQVTAIEDVHRALAGKRSAPTVPN